MAQSHPGLLLDNGCGVGVLGFTDLSNLIEYAMRPESIVSTQEACKLLDISRPTLYSWIELGKLRPWGQLGGRSAWFFLKREVLKARGKKYLRLKVAA